MSRMVADLFAEEPWQWGLRGDPYLWREMQEYFSSTPLPSTTAELEDLLTQAFLTLVGLPITHQDSIFVERLAQGGMSSGYVMPAFWRERGVPFILERYRELALK